MLDAIGIGADQHKQDPRLSFGPRAKMVAVGPQIDKVAPGL